MDQERRNDGDEGRPRPMDRIEVDKRNDNWWREGQFFRASNHKEDYIRFELLKNEEHQYKRNI